MINHQQAMPCPHCQQDEIPFDVKSLLRGYQFKCPTCASVVSLAPESVEQTKTVIEQFEVLKQQHANV